MYLIYFQKEKTGTKHLVGGAFDLSVQEAKTLLRTLEKDECSRGLRYQMCPHEKGQWATVARREGIRM